MTTPHSVTEAATDNPLCSVLGRMETSKTLIAMLSLLASVPILFPSFPPLIDLPTHLSRYHIAENIESSPYLSQYFSYSWRFIPNLGVDLLLIPLTPIFGIERSLIIIVAATCVSFVFAILAIAREVHGRVPNTTYAALPLAFAYPLIFGFVNSCLSVSLALCAFAFWLHLTRTSRDVLRIFCFLVIAPIVLTAHLIGYGVLGLLIGGHIIGRNLSRRNIPHTVRDLLKAALIIGWPLVLLLFWRTDNTSITTGWLDLKAIARFFIGTLRIENVYIDVFSLSLMLGVSLLPLLRRRKYVWVPELAVPAALLWLAVLILPQVLFGSAFASTRLIYVALAMSILAVRARSVESGWLKAALILFFLVRLLLTTIAFSNADREHNERLVALDLVRPGSRVVAFHMTPCNRRWSPPLDQHLTSFVTTRRDAFVNDQFAATAGQALTLKYGENLPKFENSQVISEPCARWELPTLEAALSRVPWMKTDYLWLLNVPPTRQPRGQPKLILLWQKGDAALYQVNHS